MEDTQNLVNHDLLSLTDKIRKVGELEHIRYHAKRASKVVKDEEEKLFWRVIALQSRDLRREVQKRHLDTDKVNWCPEKAACALKQINYEDEEDDELFERIETLCDTILSHALHEDLHGCEGCEKDKPNIE